MKKLTALAVVVASLTMSTAALAVEANTFYIGGMIGNGRLDIDASYTTTVNANGTFEINPADITLSNTFNESNYESSAFTLYGGYNIFPWLGTELHLFTMLADKELGDNLEFSASGTALYAVFQKGTADAWIKGLVGLGSTSGSVTDMNTDVDSSASTFGWSIGARIGMRVGPGAVEFMYVRYPDLKFKATEFAGGTNGRARLGRDMTAETLSVGYSYTF